jgi:DNA-binding winged helix-turn-helix (wHTH) protein
MVRSDFDNPPSELVFGRCLIDRGRGRLLIDGREIPLRPKTWALLEHLATRSDRVVSRDDLSESVWPGLLIHDQMLAEHIGELRRVFAERGGNPIVSTPAGYRFDPEAAPRERRGARGARALRWRWKYGIYVPLAMAFALVAIWWATRGGG